MLNLTESRQSIKKVRCLKMLFILLFIVMWILDWKCDTYLFFRFLGSLILGGMLLLVGVFMVSGKAIQSDTPIQTESFATSGFTQSRSGDKYFTYSNENGTFQVSADSIQMEEGTKNEIKTYKTSYPKIYKYLFFFQDGKYYKVEIKP